MYKIVLILIFLLPVSGWAQDTVWVNQDLTVALNVDKASFYYFNKEVTMNKNSGIRITRYYYPGGQLYTEQNTFDGNPTGHHLTYHRNGQKMEEGQRSGLLGSPAGEWKRWDSTGQLSQRTQYKPDGRNAIMFFRDSLGVVRVENGTGSYYVTDNYARVTSYGLLKNGYRDGIWIGLNEVGAKKYKEEYREGEFIKGHRMDGEEEIIYDAIEKPATPHGGYPNFFNFIANNLKYPAYARKKGIEGKVYIQFVVNKTGELSDFTVLKGVHSSLDDEAIRVISKAEAWSPPYQRGKLVKQKIIVPITFQLG